MRPRVVFLALRSFPLDDGETQNMADIISISAHFRKGYQPARSIEADAAIILFPGVRYERAKGDSGHADEQTHSPKGKARGEGRQKSQA